MISRPCPDSTTFFEFQVVAAGGVCGELDGRGVGCGGAENWNEARLDPLL